MVRPTANNGSTSNTKPKSKTVNVTVSLADSTAIMQTVAASEGDLAVGSVCERGWNRRQRRHRDRDHRHDLAATERVVPRVRVPGRLGGQSRSI